MRLWSLHPKYLDARGLVALWREGLLALAVLKGNTEGYRHHPQLQRFLAAKDPVDSMKAYLWFVYEEAVNREYHFNPAKIARRKKSRALGVTAGQLKYELDHLKEKLKRRSPEKYQAVARMRLPDANPFFVRVPGKIETWEKVGDNA